MTLAAYGFKPSIDVNSTAQQTQDGKVANAYATALFAGDPIRLENGYIVKAATTERIDGILVDARWVDNTTNEIKIERYLPASTTSAGTADGQLATPEVTFIPTSAGARFKAIADDTVAQANVGDFFAVTGGAGSTVLRQSGDGVDASSAADVTTAADVRVTKILDADNNEVEVEFLRTTTNIV
jgi:hypothetical protein